MNDKNKKLEEALKPFLFKKVTPNLTTKIMEALDPVIDEIAARRKSMFKVVCDETNNTPEDIEAGRLNARVMIDAESGISAGVVRGLGVAVPQNVPDCAVMRNGAWEWVETEVTIPNKKEA